jgi:hypothetical protein
MSDEAYTAYTTRDMALATFIHFCRPELHVATSKPGPFSCAFEFTDQTACAELAAAFYRRVGVDDARHLLECSKEIKGTIRKANEAHDGVWRRDSI